MSETIGPRLEGRRILVVGAGTQRSDDPEAPTTAEAVRDWNLYANNALTNAPTVPGMPGIGQAPQAAVLHAGMVQGAVYDAVNAIDGGHQPYLAGLPPASPSASTAAAAATAAHDVLVGITAAGVTMLPQPVRTPRHAR